MMKLFDVKWNVKTAGPSPFNNERTELFLLGCRKALEGNPCPECFNSPTWDDSIAQRFYTPKDIAEHLSKTAPNKYVTIGGGEPTDQIDELIELCKEIKKYGFHTMVYTWRDLRWELQSMQIFLWVQSL
jgi:pyruvate-formate lyase-activating enzyme